MHDALSFGDDREDLAPETWGEDSLGLADRLRAATRSLHRQAERSGIIRDLLRGAAGRPGYVLYLQTLLPAYRALETGLQRAGSLPALSALASTAVYRARALESDLGALAGGGPDGQPPRLPQGEAYAARIEEVAAASPHRLIAHAYVRYLGDLNGGHILGRAVARQLGLPPACLAFYRFPDIDDLDRFKADYRAGIDRAPIAEGQAREVVEEGIAAFRLNIEVSEAVAEAARRLEDS